MAFFKLLWRKKNKNNAKSEPDNTKSASSEPVREKPAGLATPDVVLEKPAESAPDAGGDSSGVSGPKYRTLEDSSPQGKPKIYFTSHPSDRTLYLEPISEEILKRHNCAVYYFEDDSSNLDEDHELYLSQMQLFVIPVTEKLLKTPNRALDKEVPYAIRHRIPILPIVEEEGLTDLFGKAFGTLQYLDHSATDETAISFDVKLTKFLDSVIIGDELAAKVRAAFDAYIFLSYRKKDRAYAQKLMKLIHQNDFCRDIAIWYDEFLTPGEDFNDSIIAALEKSDLFAMAVTPNLVNETNYVETTEYPMAKGMKKVILPAELVPTDRSELGRKYHDLPDVVSTMDSSKLNSRLKECLKGIAISPGEKDDMHNFFIGLAYLSGIDVEVDHEKALSLITGAAEAGLPEACEKLISMYTLGNGVERDLVKAADWSEKHMVLLHEIAVADDTPENLYAFYKSYYDYCTGRLVKGSFRKKPEYEEWQKWINGRIIDFIGMVYTPEEDEIFRKSKKLLNDGLACHKNGDSGQALKLYRESLAMSRESALRTEKLQLWDDLINSLVRILDEEYYNSRLPHEAVMEFIEELRSRAEKLEKTYGHPRYTQAIKMAGYYKEKAMENAGKNANTTDIAKECQ